MLDPDIARTIRDLLDAVFIERDAPLRHDRSAVDAEFLMHGRFASGAHVANVLKRFDTELKERAKIALSTALDTLDRLGVTVSVHMKADVASLLEAALRQQREKLEAFLMAMPPFKPNAGSRYPTVRQAPGSYFNDTLGIAMRHIDAQLGLRALAAGKSASVVSAPDVPVLDRPAMAGTVAGAFIAAKSPFDVFRVISGVLESAAHDVMIVDPYMDAKALTQFGVVVAPGVRLRLLADGNDFKSSLGPAARTWVAQHGAKRPLEVRLAKAGVLHDRHIFVDGAEAWLLSQSLNAFGARSHAEVVRTDEHATAKITAYEAIWSAATPLA